MSLVLACFGDVLAYLAWKMWQSKTDVKESKKESYLYCGKDQFKSKKGQKEGSKLKE